MKKRKVTMSSALWSTAHNLPVICIQKYLNWVINDNYYCFHVLLSKDMKITYYIYNLLQP
jgi:hypothetical protein